MEKMQHQEMVRLEGGGPRLTTLCGTMIAINIGLIAFSRLGALYMASKTIGVCSIALAVR